MKASLLAILRTFQVKMPFAIPEIMLGLNQTVMFGLAMLIIAALVGTRGLGQQIFVSLGNAEAGSGIIAGLGITLLAMITDRIIQAWSARRKAALGHLTPGFLLRLDILPSSIGPE